MSKVTRRLGRGLDSLVSNLRSEHAPVSAVELEPERAKSLPHSPRQVTTTVPIDSLIPNPYQPRTSIGDSDTESLSRSIATHGVLQPVAVRRVGDAFQIIAGERRVRAAKKLGIREIPVVIREANDQQMLELALVENLQREDLNAIDRANAYRQFRHDFGITAEQVADRLGEDRTTVTNYIRLLELEPDLPHMAASGILNMGHARCLLGVANPARRVELAQLAADGQLSVRALEDIVRREKAGARPAKDGRKDRLHSAHIKDLERRFEQAVKTKVLIKEARKRGKGRIIIEYYTLDDFDRIAEMLGVRSD